MFPAAYHHTLPPPRNDGPIDIQFAASRDGKTWLRPDRHPIIRRGFEGEWNAGVLYVGYGLSRQGDELSIYYKGGDVTHGAYLERGYPGGTISRAVYRLDGFMSVDAPYTGGKFTTPPIIFSGNRMVLNFDGSAGGWVRVELLTSEGEPIPGFSGEDAHRMIGNSVAETVTWGDRNDLSAFQGQPIQLRFQLRDVKLFAFQFPQN